MGVECDDSTSTIQSSIISLLKITKQFKCSSKSRLLVVNLNCEFVYDLVSNNNSLHCVFHWITMRNNFDDIKFLISMFRFQRLASSLSCLGSSKNGLLPLTCASCLTLGPRHFILLYIFMTKTTKLRLIYGWSNKVLSVVWYGCWPNIICMGKEAIYLYAISVWIFSSLNTLIVDVSQLRHTFAIES